MFTSLLIVLSGLVAPVEKTEAPAWLTDYSKASQLVARANKPLAVFLGSKADKLSRDGQLSSEAKKILADRYVCLHIDTTTVEGKALAGSFDMPSGLGIVISDRAGKNQAFRHEGDLEGATLVRYLSRYSDVGQTVRTTESNPDERVSYYPPSSAPAASYCPSCSSCSGGRCRR
jgi:hypothetical protein